MPYRSRRPQLRQRSGYIGLLVRMLRNTADRRPTLASFTKSSRVPRDEAHAGKRADGHPHEARVEKEWPDLHKNAAPRSFDFAPAALFNLGPSNFVRLQAGANLLCGSTVSLPHPRLKQAAPAAVTENDGDQWPKMDLAREVQLCGCCSPSLITRSLLLGASLARKGTERT